MTQEALAEQAGLSTDTVRRLEAGSFSPSLTTIRKICGGLKLNLSTLFDAFELGEREVSSQIANAVKELSPDEREGVLRVLRAAQAAVTSKPGDDEE